MIGRGGAPDGMGTTTVADTTQRCVLNEMQHMVLIDLLATSREAARSAVFRASTHSAAGPELAAIDDKVRERCELFGISPDGIVPKR